MILAFFFGPLSWRTDLSLKCLPKNWTYHYSVEVFLVQGLFCRLYSGWSCRMSYNCAAVPTSMKILAKSGSSLRTALLFPLWVCGIGCAYVGNDWMLLISGWFMNWPRPLCPQNACCHCVHLRCFSTSLTEGMGLYPWSWLNTYVQMMLIWLIEMCL